jgi:hypothetical protein
MKLSDETYERIERYLLQEMTTEEAAAFEATCQADPDLAAALAHEKKIHLLIRIHNQNQIRQQVRALDTAARQPRIIPFRRMALTVGSIAAILLVAIGYWWLGGSAELTGGQMAQEAEKAFAAILDPSLRGKLATAEDSLGYYLNQEAWAEATLYYLAMPDSLQARAKPRLMAAQAYYAQSDYPQADSLSLLAMGAPATATSEVPCKAKLLRVLILLRRDQFAEAKALIGYTPGEDAWKKKWECLKTQQFDALEKLDKDLSKKLP